MYSYSPNLFLPGFQKCATSTLVDILTTHKDIFSGNRKEPHFFSKDRKFSLGSKEYKKYYNKYDNEKYIIDGSQSYMTISFVPNRIKEYSGENIKSIIVLRSPVDRVESSFNYFKAIGYRERRKIKDLIPYDFFSNAFELKDLLQFEKETIPHLLKNKLLIPSNNTWTENNFPFSYFLDSSYSLHIENYLKFFDKKNILFLTFEDVIKSQNNLQSKLAQFLHLSVDGFTAKKTHTNKTLKYKYRVLNSTKFIKSFIRPVFPDIIKNRLKSIEEKYLMIKPDECFSNEVYAKLIKLYSEDLKKVETLTSLDLSGWITTEK